MPRSRRSGTLSIIQAAAIDDRRVGAAELRMLVALGTYADAEGWCWPKQKQLAARLGITRQAVSKSLRDLAEHGYIAIEHQHDEATGSQIASRYRIILDLILPSQYRRTPQPDIAGGQRHIAPPATSEVAPPVKPSFTPPATSEVAPIERPNRTTQLNDPIDIQAPTPESVLFAYYREKIQPTARVNAPEKIRARLKRFSLDELKAGIDKFAADSWWMDNNAARGVAWFFHSDQRSEQFLNLKPRSAPEQRNGARLIPPGATSKQKSSWNDEDIRAKWRVKTLGGQSDG